MHSGNAARKLDDVMLTDDTATAGFPPSEQARYEPRYRVVTRRAPSAAKGRGLSPLQRTLLCAVAPTACLLVYVMFWTLSMRGGFLLDRLHREQNRLQVEQRELLQEKRRLQAPGIVLPQAAAEKGMAPSVNQEFATISAAALSDKGKR